MKKATSILLAFCLLAALLWGCSGKEESVPAPEGNSSLGGGSSQVSSGEAAPSQASSSGSVSSGEPGEASGGVESSDGELILYTWENAFPQAVLDGFTKETGIVVQYETFGYDEAMLAKLQADEGWACDLVLADDYILETVIEKGLAQKLDTSRLKNCKSVNPLYQGQFYDPEDEYTVPYGAGVQTILVNPGAVSAEITGYASLWGESLRGRVGLIDNYRVADGMALKVLGKSWNTEKASEIEDAGKKLLELAPNIGALEDAGILEKLTSGEIGAAVMYPAQALAAKKADPSLEVVYPEEGLGFGLQSIFLASQAPHTEQAYQLLDYLLRPEVAAQCFEYSGSCSTNKDADSLISQKYRDCLTLPEEVSKDDMELIRNISDEAAAVHEKAWNEVTAACK